MSTEAEDRKAKVITSQIILKALFAIYFKYSPRYEGADFRSQTLIVGDGGICMQTQLKDILDDISEAGLEL